GQPEAQHRERTVFEEAERAFGGDIASEVITDASRGRLPAFPSALDLAVLVHAGVGAGGRRQIRLPTREVRRARGQMAVDQASSREQTIGGQVGRPAESEEVVAVFAGDVLSATSDAVAEGSRDLTEVVAGDLKLLAVLPDQMGV